MLSHYLKSGFKFISRCKSDLLKSELTERESFSSFKLEFDKYKREFEEINLIEHGIFGMVYAVKSIKDKKFYAIKKIKLNIKYTKDILNVLNTPPNLKNEYVVQCFDQWIENDYEEKNITFLPEFEKSKSRIETLYIQMEFCNNSLKGIIQTLRIEFNYDNLEILTRINYYIASELLIEILECLDYLHRKDPPLIHSGLKPSNILITNGHSGRFVKLSDIHTANLHRFDEQLEKIKTEADKYIAPEILNEKLFETKSNIYSLGLIAQELFNVDIERLVLFKE
jgi:serine/threonine protein kinase